MFGPGPDLLFGCGVLYFCFFLLLVFQGHVIQALFPLALTPLLALFLSVPHYGSTLLRVYETPEARNKYRFFAVYISGLVLLWFVAAVYNSLAGTLLVTLYMVWSPWHYMGQNYGVALMFLGRRKIAVTARTKRLIHWSFLFSYLLTLTEIQSFPASEGYYRVLTVELGHGHRDALFAVFGFGYVSTLLAAIVALKRQAGTRDLLPALLVICSQALWFLVPLFAIRFGLLQGTVALSMDSAVYAFFWVAIAHAIQYLWITSYFARQASGGVTVPGFLFKALAAGALIWMIPVFLFSPALLGNRSYDAGLAILVAAAVNVHHFILDGAIWKLREGRIAAVLLRNASGTETPGAGWLGPVLRPALLALGLFCVLAHYLGTVYSSSARQALMRGDLDAADGSMRVLQTLQRDDPQLQRDYARLALQRGEHERATRAARVAVRLDPTEFNRDFLAAVERRSRAAVGSEAVGTSLPAAPFSPRLQR